MSSDRFLNSSRILIRGLNWIGDAVMSLPAIWKIREAMPDVFITVMCPEWCADIYRICPAVNDVILSSPMGGFGGFFAESKYAKAVRKKEFDSSVVLPNSFRSALVPLFARISGRYGYSTAGRSLLLTDGLRLNKKELRHTVLYYRPLLQKLGVSWEEGSERFEMKLTREVEEEAVRIMTEKGIDPDKELIGFSPGAAWGPSKRWPPEYFSETARKLISDHSRQAVFFGSHGDIALIEEIMAPLSREAASLAGVFDRISCLVAAIRRCDLLITNDSGPMHIAAAVGTPVVAMFGPTDENISGPWTTGQNKSAILRPSGCRPCYNSRCKQKGIPCLARIPVDDVINKAEKLLQTGL